MNLERYLERIDYPRDDRDRLRPDLDCLRLLTLAHTRAVAFENLNALMREPVALDLPSLEAKLVDSPRGGYCFEQNSLFAAVLENVGLSVTRLAARVVWRLDAAERWRNPRTHMVLLVSLREGDFLCDVGFGGVTPTAPLRIDTPAAQQTPHEPFRVVRAGDTFSVQVGLGSEWQDVYEFDLQPQAAIDYEMANHYVATHPESHFRHTLICARAFDGGRYMLRNSRLSTYVAGSEKQVRELDGPEAMIHALGEVFGIFVADPDLLRAAFSNIRE